jgi:hypothetical protein
MEPTSSSVILQRVFGSSFCSRSPLAFGRFLFFYCRCCFPLAYCSYMTHSKSSAHPYIFSLFLFIFLYSITRTNLGPHKAVCLTIPIIFLVTSFVVDYVLFAEAGLEAFDYKTAYASSVPPEGYDPETYDPATDPLAGVGAGTGFVFIFCSLANFMAFFMSWFYMYDTARSEWQALQNAGAEGAQGALPPSMSYPSDVIPSATDSAGVGHAAVPNNAALLEEGANASHLYGDIVGEDLDAPKTVQDRVADRDKVRLMKSFFYAVSFYLIMAMVVFFLPIFVPMTVDAALLVFYDALLWIFLAGLLIVFRMRESNQFLMIGEDGEGNFETTTELGVLYRREDTAQNTGNTQTGGTGGVGSTSGMSGGGGTSARYTLGDDDDEEIAAGGVEDSHPYSSRPGGGIMKGSSGNVNASAASQGVVVQPLPIPQS